MNYARAVSYAERRSDEARVKGKIHPLPPLRRSYPTDLSTVLPRRDSQPRYSFGGADLRDDIVGANNCVRCAAFQTS